MKVAHYHLIICAALITMTGCGKVSLNTNNDVDASPPPDAPPPDPCTGDVALANAWECAVSTVCDVVSECFGGAVTPETCRNLDLQIFNTSAHYGDVLFQGGVQQGTITYDGQAMGQCIEHLRSLTCIDVFSINDPFDGCQAFSGAVPPNDTCTLTAECAVPGSNCSAPNCGIDELCCMGACQSPTPIGGTCGVSGQLDCEPGAHCVDGLCRGGGIGARCNVDYDCDPENWCDGNTCAADFAAGSACVDTDQCAAPTSCLGINTPLGGRCERSIVTGDPCENSCRSFVSHYCDRPDPTQLGSCQPRLGEGSSCTQEVMPCQIDLRCDTASLTCQSYGQAGSSCTSSNECSFFLGVYCSNDIDGAPNGVCQGRLTDGERCTNDRHCDSGYCRQGTCTPAMACY